MSLGIKLLAFILLFCLWSDTLRAHSVVEVPDVYTYIPSSEVALLEKRLNKLSGEKHFKERIVILNELVKLTDHAGEYLMAILYAEQILKESEVYLPASTDQYELLKRLGDLCFKGGEFCTALEYYQKVLDLTNVDNLARASVCHTMSKACLSLELPERALQLVKQALKLDGLQNNKVLYSALLLQAGTIQRENEQYDEAALLLSKALKLISETGNSEELGAPYYQLAQIAYARKDYQKSMALVRTAFDLYRSISKQDGIARCYSLMGCIMAGRNELKIAEEYYAQSILHGRMSGDKKLLNNILLRAARNKESLHKYQDALELYKRYGLLHDSIINEASARKIAEMQMQYNYFSKQQEIESLKSQNEIKALTLKKNKMFLYALVVSVIVIILAGLYYFQQNRYKYDKKLGLINQKLLRIQMNPHFIFNALSAIQSFVLVNDPKEAGRYLSTFARLIRLVLENSKSEFVPIEREERLLRYYLELQQLRFSNKFEYNIYTDDEIRSYEMLVPTMITQPFIENSIEHGILGISGKGKIDIHFKYTKDHILLIIEDNGVGMDESKVNGKNSEHKSLATIITSERLKLLNKKSKNKFSLVFSKSNMPGSINPGTRVSIEIPFMTAK